MALISCVIQYILVLVCFICSNLYVSYFNTYLHRLDDTEYNISSFVHLPLL